MALYVWNWCRVEFQVTWYLADMAKADLLTLLSSITGLQCSSNGNNPMCCKCGLVCHDDVIKWKKISALLDLCAANSPVNSPHKGQWRRALLFYFIWAWTNGLVYNRDAGDLRWHRAHYYVTVMSRDGNPHLILLPANQHAVGSHWSLLEHNNLLKSLLN